MARGSCLLASAAAASAAAFSAALCFVNSLTFLAKLKGVGKFLKALKATDGIPIILSKKLGPNP